MRRRNGKGYSRVSRTAALPVAASPSSIGRLEAPHRSSALADREATEPLTRGLVPLTLFVGDEPHHPDQQEHEEGEPRQVDRLMAREGGTHECVCVEGEGGGGPCRLEKSPGGGKSRCEISAHRPVLFVVVERSRV